MMPSKEVQVNDISIPALTPVADAAGTAAVDVALAYTDDPRWYDPETALYTDRLSREAQYEAAMSPGAVPWPAPAPDRPEPEGCRCDLVRLHPYRRPGGAVVADAFGTTGLQALLPIIDPPRGKSAERIERQDNDFARQMVMDLYVDRRLHKHARGTRAALNAAELRAAVVHLNEHHPDHPDLDRLITMLADAPRLQVDTTAERRRRIAAVIDATGETRVRQLAEVTGISRAAVQRHLNALRRERPASAWPGQASDGAKSEPASRVLRSGLPPHPQPDNPGTTPDPETPRVRVPGQASNGAASAGAARGADDIPIGIGIRLEVEIDGQEIGGICPIVELRSTMGPAEPALSELRHRNRGRGRRPTPQALRPAACEPGPDD
jgi:hypothetical protein